MGLKVTISQRAEKSLDSLLEYLEKKWSTKVKDDFKNNLVRKVENISDMPLMYPESGKRKGVRSKKMCSK